MRRTSLFVALWLVMRSSAAPAVDSPLSKVEILSLLAAGSLPSELVKPVGQYGISFTPSDGDFAEIAKASVVQPSQVPMLRQSLLTARRTSPQSEPKRESELIAHLIAGAQMASSANYAGAEGEFRQALQIKAKSSVLHLPLGAVLANERKFDSAIPEIRTALDARPGISAIHVLLGWALESEGKLDDAMAQLQEAARLDAGSYRAHYLLSSVFFKKRDFQNSAGEARKAVQAAPAEPQLHNALGTVLFVMGDVQEAIQEFRKAIQLGTADAEVHTDLALALKRSGDLDGAIAEFRQYVTLQPNSYMAHYRLGAALTDKGDLDSALSEYREAIRLNPNCALCYSETGYVLRSQSDIDGAIAEYRRAIQIDPKLAPAHHNLGKALCAKGDFTTGYREIRIAHDLAPEDSKISAEYEKIPQAFKEGPSPVSSLPSQTTAPMASAVTGDVNAEDSVSYLDTEKGSLITLEAETLDLRAHVNGFTNGVKVSAAVPGASSPVRFTGRSHWEFVVHVAGATRQANFPLVRLEITKDSRRVPMPKNTGAAASPNALGALAGLVQQPYGTDSVKVSVPFELRRGEYGFLIVRTNEIKLFCFGVD